MEEKSKKKPLFFAPLCKDVPCGDTHCFDCAIGDKILDLINDARSMREEDDENDMDD